MLIFGDSCSFQCPQDIRRDIIGMQLHANAFGNNKVFLDGTDDLSQPVCRKGRCAAAKNTGCSFPFYRSADRPQRGSPAAEHLCIGRTDPWNI